jgi:hypothetical protein
MPNSRWVSSAVQPTFQPATGWPKPAMKASWIA